MPTYIALLRGINVGGHKRIKMSDLRECFNNLGFQNVQTYIQSGNVVFDCSETNVEEVKKRIEEGLIQSFGFDVTAVMRSKAEFQQLVTDAHFLREKVNEPTKLSVTFLSENPGRVVQDDIFDKVKSETETLLLDGKEIYLHCPDGFRLTKLSNNYLEKMLKMPVTTRNWKTVTMLHELMD